MMAGMFDTSHPRTPTTIDRLRVSDATRSRVLSEGMTLAQVRRGLRGWEDRVVLREPSTDGGDAVEALEFRPRDDGQIPAPCPIVVVFFGGIAHSFHHPGDVGL